MELTKSRSICTLSAMPLAFVPMIAFRYTFHSGCSASLLKSMSSVILV